MSIIQYIIRNKDKNLDHLIRTIAKKNNLSLNQFFLNTIKEKTQKKNDIREEFAWFIDHKLDKEEEKKIKKSLSWLNNLPTHLK